MTKKINVIWRLASAASHSAYPVDEVAAMTDAAYGAAIQVAMRKVSGRD